MTLAWLSATEFCHSLSQRVYHEYSTAQASAASSRAPTVDDPDVVIQQALWKPSNRPFKTVQSSRAYEKAVDGYYYEQLFVLSAPDHFSLFFFGVITRSIARAHFTAHYGKTVASLGPHPNILRTNYKLSITVAMWYHVELLHQQVVQQFQQQNIYNPATSTNTDSNPVSYSNGEHQYALSVNKFKRLA